MEVVDLDYLESVIQLAEKYGVIHLRVGPIELSFEDDEPEPRTVGFSSQTVEIDNLEDVEFEEMRKAPAYSAKSLWPKGRPTFTKPKVNSGR